jgi:hypothetical protein
MDIGAFGIDPASKFATDKCKSPKWKLALGPDFHRLDRTSLPGALIRSPHRRAAGSTLAA